MATGPTIGDSALVPREAAGPQGPGAAIDPPGRPPSRRVPTLANRRSALPDRRFAVSRCPGIL